jgi:hypothetical protein
MGKVRSLRGRIAYNQVLCAFGSIVIGLITARLWFLEGYALAIVVLAALIMCASTFIIFTFAHDWVEHWLKARHRQ